MTNVVAFINDKRVQTGLLKPGEELRLDTVRFLLVTPGMDARAQSAAPRVEASAPEKRPVPMIWIVIAVVALAALGFVLHSQGVF